MKQLVRLRIRPSRDGTEFTYFLDYLDEYGKRRRISLNHADKRKAEKQRDQFERELRLGVVAPSSLKLSEFLKDSLCRTRGQVRDSSLKAYKDTFKDFIRMNGNTDYQLISIKQGERYVQACRDRGNSPATVGKKVRHLKRIFQLAVERGQLEQNPFRFLKQPKCPAKKIRVLSNEECCRLLETAYAYPAQNRIHWPLLLKLALNTGLRKGEILNLTWMDVDFEAKTVEVSPKSDTEHTWQWHTKNSERRLLPVEDTVMTLLAEHQSQQETGNPYLFVPAERYAWIGQLRKAGQWDVIKGKNPLSNFDRQFKAILKRAGITGVTFHDLRRTCLTNWYNGGL